MTSPAPPAQTRRGESGELQARENRGVTSRLILSYVEREKGPEAVVEVLRRAGLEDYEDQLHDENYWFPYAHKIALFQAAGAVLGDHHVARHVGAAGIELNVGAGLKRALRALGSPRLVYGNIVRACGKFTATHRMSLEELESDRARISYMDIGGVGYHRHDCEYNIGLLSCIPELFGLPPARVTHSVCAVHGADTCIYDVQWHGGGAEERSLFAGIACAGATIGASLLFLPAALPVAVAVGIGAVGAGAWTTAGGRRRRWRLLEARLEQQAEVSERLATSLQELVSELRLEEALAKITHNAQTTVGGKEFALLVEDDGAIRCQSASALPSTSIAALEHWAERVEKLAEASIVIDDLGAIPELADLAEHPEIPLGSLCAAPLTYRGQSLGVLVAFSPTIEAFLPHDVELMQSYAAQAAIALANARMFEAQQALASRDPLTGLLNHREFHETVGRELERCRRYGGSASVVLFDLDGFKLVNDVSGHAEGDRVLRGVAHALAQSCRAADLAFRVGGDELALVLPDTGPEAAVEVVARAAAAISEVDARTSVSFGIGGWPDHGPTKTTLLRRADEQLYAMKGQRATTALAYRGAPEARHVDHQRERLAIASRLSSRLAALEDEREIVQVTVDELDRTFGYFLAVVHRLDRHDETLRLVAVAGQLASALDDIGQWAQSLRTGVLGRVARTGEPMMVHDTRLDPDFVTPDERVESRSELALPIRVAGEVWGVLNLEAADVGAFGEDDLLLATMIAAQVGAAIHRSRLSHDREDTFMTALGVLCDALETKDSYTAAHAREVADLCEQVGARLGVGGEELRNLSYAALLHDIGKIGVRAEILRKPGPLEDYEFEEIKLHTVIGADMLSRIPAFAGVQSLVRSAHERWDGHGYPDGLHAQEIPLGARIICACDAFHAMTSDRPYRDAMPIPVAIAELRAGAGRQFDPEVVDALIAEIASVAAR